MLPEDLKYTAEHEWVRVDDDGPARIGITDYAQDQLGDIVYVQLPEVGEQVEAGGPIGELESTKSVSDIFAPVTGSVANVNEALAANPELCNSDPYGGGWILEVDMSEPQQIDELLTAADYQATIASQ